MSKYYKTKENVVFDTIVNLVMICLLYTSDAADE